MIETGVPNNWHSSARRTIYYNEREIIERYRDMAIEISKMRQLNDPCIWIDRIIIESLGQMPSKLKKKTRTEASEICNNQGIWQTLSLLGIACMLCKVLSMSGPCSGTRYTVSTLGRHNIYIPHHYDIRYSRPHK